MIIAVDFDGTLCGSFYPECGSPNKKLIRYLLRKQRKGAELILWTCRCGEALEKAVKWCESYGLIFDYVNENADSAKERFGSDCRKIFADLYIDDKAWNVNYWLDNFDGKEL